MLKQQRKRLYGSWQTKAQGCVYTVEAHPFTHKAVVNVCCHTVQYATRYIPRSGLDRPTRCSGAILAQHVGPRTAGQLVYPLDDLRGGLVVHEIRGEGDVCIYRDLQRSLCDVSRSSQQTHRLFGMSYTGCCVYLDTPLNVSYGQLDGFGSSCSSIMVVVVYGYFRLS